jgi:cell wall-associated NlpC family hydrolase
MTQPSNAQRGGQQQQSDYFYPFAGINPFDPPDMKTFVYAPEVRILIARGNKQYDVSRDIIRGTIIRKENSASTLFFTLANKGDYNGLFHRMDRVVVFLKRVKWQQVFSGYLDTVPFAQLYGGAAEYKATCTLKRLLHTWWSPTLPASQGIFNQNLFANQYGGDGQLPADSGLGSMMRRLLCLVGGWQPQDVHIQNFPMVFYDFLQSQLVAKRNLNQQAAQNFKRLLLGKNYNNAAPGQYAGYDQAAGPPGPPGKGEPYYIAQIVAACDALGLGPRIADLTNSQQTTQAAAAGAQSRDEAARNAFTQVGQAESTRYQQAQNSDAAILGVAAAMVETGGGTTILNLANPGTADSMRFPHDGTGQDYDSIGIFQQRNSWGTVSQRMDPRQAATMFFNALPPDWRNLPPGEAIQRAQRSAFPERYAPAIPLATQKVQAYREQQKGTASAVAATPLGAAVTAAGAPVGINPATVASTATTTPGSPGDARTRLNKPNPDSEGAVQEALQQLGKPYIWGARGPESFDCSGLFVWSFRAVNKDSGGNTYGIMQNTPQVDPSQIQRGDLIIVNGGEHVIMWLGDGSILEAAGNGPSTTVPTPGQSVQRNPASSYPPDQWVSVHRVCPNGGVDPTAPRLPPLTTGPGTPAGTGDVYSRGAGASASDEPIAQNLFAYQFTPERFASQIASQFTFDHKEFLDAEPLMQMVQAVSRASLRNFASAPDGSFMAYYPDYFGLDGKKAIVRLEDIELRDVKINFSDDNLTTHVYVAGDHTFLGQEPNLLAWLETAGSVTVEHDWLFQRLQKIAPGDLGGVDGKELMKRFGVRPLKVPVAMAGSESLEFLLACQIFMEKWAQQYQTSASFTFLPELFPGMRVILAGHNLQVYVSEVTHTFDFENGFSTQAVIMAPSRTDAATAMAGTSGYFGGPDDTGVARGLGFNPDGTTSAEVVGG